MIIIIIIMDNTITGNSSTFYCGSDIQIKKISKSTKNQIIINTSEKR